MFAYVNMNSPSIRSLLFCSAASVGDAVYIAVLYVVGGVLQNNPLWICCLNGKSVFAIMLTGFATASITEHIAVLQDWWQYRESMPRLPFGIGLWPVVQLVTLPIVTYWIVCRSAKPEARLKERSGK
jgi:hypothetical protein